MTARDHLSASQKCAINKMNKLRAAMHRSGVIGGDVWRMGGNLQAIGIRLGESHHVLVCDYATESGNWAALLMRDDDEHPIRISESTPLTSARDWEHLYLAFESARMVVQAEVDADNYGCAAIDDAIASAFTAAKELGWDYTVDDEWYEWTLKATELEILAEGLRRALQNCQVGQKED